MDDCSSSEESDSEEEPEDGLVIPELEDQNEGELLGGWVWSVTSVMAELD